MGAIVSIPDEIGTNLYTLLGLGDTIDKAVNRKVVAYEIKFYIQDDSSTPKWVDFSDRIDSEGVNRLVSLASMTIKTEDKEDGSSFSTTLSGVTLDNHDGFFDDHIESYVKEAGTQAAADFDESKNWQENVFYRNKCKVVGRFHLANGTSLDYTLGIFLVERLETSYPFGTAELTITGLQKPLMEQSAESVKGGTDWYRRVPVTFLVRALLENYYGKPLDRNWILQDVIELETANEGSTKYISRYGRPPTLIGTGLGTASEQINYNVASEYVRAICVWEWGTKNPESGALSYISTNGTSNTLIFTSPPYLANDGIRPGAGDVIEIYDSTNGNDGFYTINSSELISNALYLYLRTPLPGTVDTHNESYHIHRVYMGIGEELWYWIPKRDVYFKVDVGKAGKNIRRLWFNRTKGNVYGAAWTDPNMYGDIRVSFDCFRVKQTTGCVWVSDDGGAVVTNVITGEICLVPSTYSGNVYHYTGFYYGEDIILPFKQQIGISTANTYPIVWYLGNKSFILGGNYQVIESETVDTTAYQQEYVPGCYYIRSEGVAAAFHTHFSLGQVGCIVYNPNYGNDGTIFLTKYSSLTSNVPNYQYGTLDIDTGTETWTAANPYESSSALFPLCGCPIDTALSGTNKYYIYFAGIEFKTTPYQVADYYPSYILKVNLTNLTATTVWTDVEGNYSTPLDMVSIPEIVIGAEDRLIVSGINNRTYLFSTENNSIKYKVGAIVSGVWTTDCLQSTPFVKMIPEVQRHENLATLTRRIIGIDPERGQIRAYEFNVAGVTTGYKILDNYNTFSDLDSNCYSNLAIAYKRSYDDYGGTVNYNNIFSIIYGISSPHYDNDLMITPVVGEYLLWKFENSLSVSPAIADFSGMKIWDAIEDLAKATLAVTNFDNNGNFFFVKRSLANEVSRIYSPYDDSNYTLTSINKQRAFDEIYNTATFTPNKVAPSETEFSVTFPTQNRVTTASGLTTPLDNYPGDSDFVIGNSNNSKISIILHCITGGILYNTAFGVDATVKQRSKWKWLIETNIIETTLITQATGTTVDDITINDISSITEDMFAIVTLSNQTEAVMKIVAGSIDTVNNQFDWDNITNTTGTQVGLTGAASDVFPIGTIVKFINAANINSSTDTPSYWSSDGVTCLATAATGDLIGDGTDYIAVNDVSRISPGNYLQLSTTSTAANTPDSTSRYYLKVTEIDKDYTPNRVYFVWGDGVTPGNYLISGGSATNTFPAGTTPETRTVVKAFWVPFYSDLPSEIGNSGIRLNITLLSIDVDYFWFNSGDNIHINSEGLKLESASEQKIVISNATSIGKYGKKEYSMGENKFMQKSVALALAQNVVAEYADPKYVFEVSTLLDPTLTLTTVGGVINRVKIRNKELFPRSPGYERECKIRQIQHNFRNFTTNLTLKDVDAY